VASAVTAVARDAVGAHPRLTSPTVSPTLARSQLGASVQVAGRRRSEAFPGGRAGSSGHGCPVL